MFFLLVSFCSFFTAFGVVFKSDLGLLLRQLVFIYDMTIFTFNTKIIHILIVLTSNTITYAITYTVMHNSSPYPYFILGSALSSCRPNKSSNSTPYRAQRPSIAVSKIITDEDPCWTSYHRGSGGESCLVLLARVQLDISDYQIGDVLLLRRRRARISAGSLALSPDVTANRFKTSVSETTPVSRPDKWAPGIAAAGTDTDTGERVGEEPEGVSIDPCAGPAEEGVRTVDSRRSPLPDPLRPRVRLLALGDREWLCLDADEPCPGFVGERSGVWGADGDGDGASTTHMRCERVATSFATVWARVECGLM